MQKLQRVRGRNLNVCTAGEGAPLLFVHGFPLDHEMWRSQIELFARTHFVIAPDLRGFGKSEVDESASVSMKEFAEDLVALMDALSLSQPATFCGLSMGGYIGWQLLKFHPNRFVRVIMANTKASADDEATERGRRMVARQVLKHGVGEVAHHMPMKLLASGSEVELVEELRGKIAGTDVRSIAAAHLGMAERPDMTSFLSEVQQSTLLVCGEHDEITTPSEMALMADLIPHARYLEIAGAGHMTPMEAPNEFNQAVTEFLAETS